MSWACTTHKIWLWLLQISSLKNRTPLQSLGWLQIITCPGWTEGCMWLLNTLVINHILTIYFKVGMKLWSPLVSTFKANALVKGFPSLTIYYLPSLILKTSFSGRWNRCCVSTVENKLSLHVLLSIRGHTYTTSFSPSQNWWFWVLHLI